MSLNYELESQVMTKKKVEIQIDNSIFNNSNLRKMSQMTIK